VIGPTASATRRPLQWSLLAGLAAAILLATTAAAAADVWVKTRYATVRDGQTSRSAVVAQVKRGQALPVLRQDKGFFQVTLPDGKTGWISRIWVDTARPKGGDARLEKLGKVARQGDQEDVSFTAGARGLTPQARDYAQTKGTPEVAEALERLEQVRVSREALDAFLAAGRLGPWRAGAPE
jgi:hypothetical protein